MPYKVPYAEMEHALKKDQRDLVRIRQAIRLLEAGHDVPPYSLIGARQTERSLVEVIENKQRLLRRGYTDEEIGRPGIRRREHAELVRLLSKLDDYRLEEIAAMANRKSPWGETRRHALAAAAILRTRRAQHTRLIG